MDGRKALAPGTTLTLHTRTGYTVYRVRREIGRGGSCIVYDASSADNLGNDKLVRIKECYPHAMRLVRAADGSLTAEEKDRAAFEAAKRRITEAYQKNHALFMTDALTNSVANTSNLYEEHGTVYIVSAWLNGQTFAQARPASLHDCIALMLSTAIVLQNLHDAGFLYLDLKPENILTIKGSLDLVQLFDFDATVRMADLQSAAAPGISYTRGYAPVELQTGNLRQIGRHSDLYSLGAVLFEALWHRTPTAFDCAAEAAYDFSSMAYPRDAYQDALFRELTVFFHKTLASYYKDRYQDASEAIEQLRHLLALSDETKPFLFSTPIPAPACLIGRETELQALSSLLRTPGQHVFHLYGMAGIGKSTLVRAWLGENREGVDALLWLHDQGSAEELLCDDLAVHVNTLERANDEPQEAYFQRKRRALAEIAARQRVLVVLDDVQPAHMADLQPLLCVGWDVLLISREAMPEGLYPSLRVEELPPDALARLFARYAHAEIQSEDDARDFETLIGAVYGHTLTVELLGRQIARSYLTLHEAAQMVLQAGFRALPEEKIDYVRDQQAFFAPLTRILDKLVEIDRFSQEERHLLQILSGLGPPGIQISLLRALTSAEVIETLHRLASCGWLVVAAQRIAFHPLMVQYFRSWPWTPDARQTLDGLLIRLHEQINPDRKQPDLDKQFPPDYRALRELLAVSGKLLARAEPISPASQLLRFRVLMDAPVDQDEAVLDGMIALLEQPQYLDARCVLRLYGTAAFMLSRLGYVEDAHELLEKMWAYLRKHPSHYYASLYHRAKAIITYNHQFGQEKARECIRHARAAIREARASRHPDAHRQLAAVLLNQTQTLLEAHKKMRRCGEMLREAARLLANEPEGDYEVYHCDCVSAMYHAMIGEESAALAHMRRATEHANAGKDSPLAFAEHLLDETAAVYIELGRLTDAMETVTRAIAVCDEHEDIRRYREVRFDATLFLGRIYAMHGEYVKAEETFAEAEKRLSDSPYAWALPLCPEDIREKARAERASRHG